MFQAQSSKKSIEEQGNIKNVYESFQYEHRFVRISPTICEISNGL